MNVLWSLPATHRHCNRSQRGAHTEREWQKEKREKGGGGEEEGGEIERGMVSPPPFNR